MKKTKRILGLGLTIALIGVILTGCSGNSTTGDSISGSIAISGSSALQPLVQIAATDFKTANPNLSITVNAGGSGTGLSNVAAKSVDIGNSDVFAIEKLDPSQASQLVDHKVCVVGVATVVNSEVKISNLSKQQLIDIYTGKITNWKDVGGSDMAIVLINRPASSGTRALFKQYALGGLDEASGQGLTEDNSGTLAQMVKTTKGSIAYLALSYTKTDTNIKTLSIDGQAPTYENIYKGAYPVWGYEHMYTNGEATGAVKAFLDFIASDKFASKIEANGYGAIGKMQVNRPDPTSK